MGVESLHNDYLSLEQKKSRSAPARASEPWTITGQEKVSIQKHETHVRSVHTLSHDG
jgi:hypothetical protein